jgi:hypothetical protein
MERKELRCEKENQKNSDQPVDQQAMGEQVTKTFREVYDLICTRHDQVYPALNSEESRAKSRWLFFGRVINCLFMTHYGFAIGKVCSTVAEEIIPTPEAK